MPSKRFQKTSGVALVSVLLVVFVLVAVTGRLLSSHNLVVSRHVNAFEYNQALQYLLGAESMAKEALHSDYLTTGPKIDHLGEIWAKNIMPFELDEGGFLEIYIKDLHGCINLNNVISETGADEYKTVRKLLVSLGLPTQIEDLWRDWVDNDSEVKGLGAEDRDYASFQIPYRTPNRLVTDLSEVMLLRDITPDYFKLITQHSCLLPDSKSQINVNTAPSEILQILGEGASISEIAMLTESQRAFETPAKFLESYPMFQKSLSRLTTSSMYFEMHAQANVGSTSVSLLTLMYRNPKDGKISILKRDFGKLFKSKFLLESQIQAI